MFNSTGITSIDLSHFNTSKVTTMNSMFLNCYYLSTITQNFDTSNVLNMENMFGNCQRLSNLNITNFDTSKVIDMGSMFYNCWNMVISVTIRFQSPEYTEMFFSTATNSPAQITIKYTSTTSNVVDQMLTTKSESSNVIKGTLVS